MRIELARLYSYTRNDGAVTLSGRCGYNGRLKIEPNPDFDETDSRSAPFVAILEEAAPKSAAQRYNGPQLTTPRPVAPRRDDFGALPVYEGEVVDR